MPNTLFLRLEGPLQSWGERAQWSVRDSAPEPTKSGVVGLLACALGLQADDDLRALTGQLRLGVRCDRPGVLLVDYHTVYGGVMSAQGKVKINATTREPETVVSLRYYLCDASFLAVLQGEPPLIARLADAVRAPRWVLYLGRKSCPPSRPLYEGAGDYETLESAMDWRRPAGDMLVRAVLECAPGEGVRRRDEFQVPSRRIYATRHTRDVALSLQALPEEDE
jgi:CRISPR system Cascade subunit CasD